MGSSNSAQPRQGYPGMMQQPQMGYAPYGSAMPSYARYQGMPVQQVGMPPIPYRQGMNYGQPMIYNNQPQIYQVPVEYAQPAALSYSPSRTYEMANYAIPQRASYMAPIQSQIPMIRDDSAIIPSQPLPQSVVRRSLTPPPVLRSQVTAFPDANTYYNTSNIQAAPIISQSPPTSEIITQQPLAPFNLQGSAQTIQVTGENIIPNSTFLQAMDYTNFGATSIPATYTNYPQYISGAPFNQTGLYANTFQQPQVMYSGNLSNNFMIPNQPYQLPILNQPVATAGMIPSQLSPAPIQVPVASIPTNPKPIN